MLPVHIVHLYLHEIPMIFVMQSEEMVKCLLAPVERKAQMAYPSCLAFLQHEVHHPVVHVTLLECLHSATSDGMQKIIVEIIRPQLLHRVPVDFQRSLCSPDIEIRHLRRDIIAVPRITAQRLACSGLRLSLEICRGSVIIIHTVAVRIIHHLVNSLLVNHILPVRTLDHRPPHAAVTEKRNLAPVGSRPDFHLSRTLVPVLVSGRRTTGQ